MSAKTKTPHRPHHSLMIGGVTGVIVGITLQPLEILKTNLIINPTKNHKIDHHNPFKSIIFVTKEIFRMDGIKGFWRGLTPALLKLSLSAGFYFAFLSKIEQKFNAIHSKYMKENTKNFLSSSISRSLSGLLTNPIQVVRTRFEVMGFSQYNNIRDAFKKIYKNEGLKGFTSGIGATVLRDAPFAGIYFMIYVRSKRFLEEKNNGWNLLMKTFVSGIVAGVVATTLTNPFDIIRARMQYSFFILDEKKKYKSVWDGIEKIKKNEGWGGFLKGLAPRLMRKPLSNSITFVVFEVFHNAINNEEAF